MNLIGQLADAASPYVVMHAWRRQNIYKKNGRVPGAAIRSGTLTAPDRGAGGEASLPGSAGHNTWCPQQSSFNRPPSDKGRELLTPQQPKRNATNETQTNKNRHGRMLDIPYIQMSRRLGAKHRF